MSNTPHQEVPIKDAATVILVREKDAEPHVLMGQRGKAAVFMPNKFVFPGGGLDAADKQISLAGCASNRCMSRLTNLSDADLANPLLAAAIREMWEETGHALGRPSKDAIAMAAQQPETWRSFYNAGFLSLIHI